MSDDGTAHDGRRSAVLAARGRLPYGQGRTALVDASIRLVAREGLGRLTYRSLTAEAGVSQGSLRHHFADLDAVLEAGLERCFQIWSRRLPTPIASIQDIFDGLFVLIRERPDAIAFQVEVFLGARHNRALRDLAVRHETAYRSEIRAALAQSHLPTDPELVDMLVYLAEGVAYRQVVFGGEVCPPDRDARVVNRMFALLDGRAP